MDFSKTKNVFILDIIDYEINISGRNYGGANCYKIYWDDKNKKRISSISEEAKKEIDKNLSYDMNNYVYLDFNF